MYSGQQKLDSRLLLNLDSLIINGNLPDVLGHSGDGLLGRAFWTEPWSVSVKNSPSIFLYSEGQAFQSQGLGSWLLAKVLASTPSPRLSLENKKDPAYI